MSVDVITKILDELTQRLAGPAKESWAIYIKQVYIDAITSIIWGLLFICITIIIIKIIIVTKNDSEKEEWSDDISRTFIYTFGAIGAITTSIASMWYIVHGIQNFINPYYYALQMLVQTIK